MIRFGNTRGILCHALLATLAVFLAASRGAGQEFRAMWVDAFHAGFRTSAEVSQLVADARAGNFNVIIPEVRKRGDAYYNSNFEPKAPDVSPQSFDPLADLCAKAHNTNNGPRIEVHAWIVAYPIWNNSDTNTAPASHALRQHLDWLSETSAGTQFSGNYVLDPGHPGVQQHTFNVAMDIITRYDVDGLNFDYIRYFDSTWGYNPVAVARFNARYGRSGVPVSSDADWKQFRRDQVTALVRKVYLSTIAVKPLVKITADTIGGTPGVLSDASFVSSSQAYKDRLQDWRGWMEEGILDANILMAYFNQVGQYAPDWTNWNAYIKDRRYSRHSIVGPGIYLNSASNALFQMRYSRRSSPAGNFADGVCGYSYAVPASDGTTKATFLAALTQTNTSLLYETNLVPLFATPTTVPIMPWKTSPTRGHVKGFVFNGTNGAGFDGATVTLAGPTNRTLRTDATGFYGAVDLPPGSYTVMATNSGFQARSTNFTVSPGIVATRDLTLPLIVPAAPQNISNVLASAGGRAAIISWTTTNAASSQVQYGFTTNYGNTTVEDSSPVTRHAVVLAGLAPGSNYFFGVISRAGANTVRSDGWNFLTAGELILDNTDAAFTGTWITATASTDKYGADYRYATVTSGGASATANYTPAMATRGNYDVFVWYPQGGNRTTNAQFTIYFNGGSIITRLNQEANGGGWRQIGTNLNFLPGTSGLVRIINTAPDDGQVVMADAVRFVYRADQDTPAGLTAPDWWAFHYFGTNTNTNAAADSDGDGYANWAEYLAGTVPTNAVSRLGFGLAPSGGAWRANFAPLTPGRTYQLQQRLIPSGWLTLTNVPATAGTNGQGWFTITNGSEAVRVLRLKVDWAP